MHILASIGFLLVFVSALIFMHVYPMQKLLGLSAEALTQAGLAVPTHKALSLSFSLCLVFLVMLAFMLGTFFPKGVLGTLHKISSFWLGALFIFFFVVLCVDLIGRFLPITPFWQIVLICVCTTTLLILGIDQGTKISIKTTTITTPKISKAYRLILLSDLHLGYQSAQNVATIVSKVKKLKPHAVLITGDLIDSNAFLPDDLLAFNELSVPIYYTFGNHEFYIKKGVPEHAISQTNIQLLRNQRAELDELQIWGVDDNRHDDLEAQLKQISIDKQGFTILMKHSPTQINKAAKRGVDLVLSGHTHGGQIFPFNFLVRIFYHYVAGLYEVKGTKLYVTEGTSFWGPPIRLGTHNEIAVIELKPTKTR